MKLLLIGCGHMGKALLKCFENNPMITDITVIDPAFQSDKHQVFRDIADVTDDYDVLILAVKPQVYPSLKIKFNVLHLVSIMAGVPYAQLEKDFPNSIIVRAMPNMAIAYEKGLTVLYGNPLVPQPIFTIVLAHTGLLKWVDQESELDMLTLFNACGPGLLLGILQEFAAVLEQYGFSEPESAALMKQVLIGTSAILEQDKRPLPDLIDSIATKAGITEACLNVLRPGIRSVLTQTIKMGLERIQTIGK